MNRQEVIEQLNSIPTGDAEAVHSIVEKMLMEFLRSEGFSDVADAYEQCRDRVGFQYA